MNISAYPYCVLGFAMLSLLIGLISFRAIEKECSWTPLDTVGIISSIYLIAWSLQIILSKGM